MEGSVQIKVGALRKTLESQKTSWKINDQLKDDQNIPKYVTGAATRGGRKIASKLPEYNFRKKLVDTYNPFLLKRRIELGFIDKKKLNDLSKEFLDGGRAAEDLAGGTAPTSVDWRNRWGWPWITTIRDQNGCNACWAFAPTALIEAMTRIKHCIWTERSEGDVHKGMGKVCANTGGAISALDWIKTHDGLADPDCFPWTTADIAYTPTIDRNGRTVKIDSYDFIGPINDQKIWLDTVGPLITHFDVWSDFFAYGSGVYKMQPVIGIPPNQVLNEIEGGHFMLVVGYDDGQGCWIVKNSWGTSWGESGFCRIAYGECKIDYYAKIGLQNTDPDPWTKRRLNNGVILESGNGKLHQNFEILVPAGSNSMQHWFRDNSVSGFPWVKQTKFGKDIAGFPTLIGSTYNRNLECVYLTKSNRLHHQWFNQQTKKWIDGTVFGPTDADGVPGFIQSNYNAPGNFEVVVRTKDYRLNHWWRMNHPPFNWNDGGRFANNVSFSGAALVQSRFGKKGNFELVCVTGEHEMEYWWRDNDGDPVWRRGAVFGKGIQSPPCIIESSFGADNEKTSGNFELCVSKSEQVEHWWRNNDGSFVWHQGATFGSKVKQVLGLMQGSFGFNLELIVLRTDDMIQHYYRDGNGWHEGVTICHV